MTDTYSVDVLMIYIDSVYISDEQERYMRTTSDKKGNVIRIRINDEMSEWLKKRYTVTGKSISEYIRDLIIMDMRSRKS